MHIAAQMLEDASRIVIVWLKTTAGPSSSLLALFQAAAIERPRTNHFVLNTDEKQSHDH